MKEGFLNSIEYFGIFIGIVLSTIFLAFLVNRFFRRLIKRSSEDLNNDPTNYLFLRHAITGITYIVGFSVAIYMMPSLRTLAGSLLAGAGILAVAVGFASQHALGNIISGVFLVIFKPYRVKDRVKVREMVGIVEDITLRHTVIRDYENRRIIIPNALISEEVIINSDFGEDKICKWIEIGISYDSNIQKARKIIQEEVMNHPLHLDPRNEEQIENGDDEVPVKVVGLGDSAVKLKGWAWAKDSADGYTMFCDVLESIKLRFDQEDDIEIPFPHRTIVLKGDRIEPEK